MRDLIRNYKMIIKRQIESDSDPESQPLVSSSSSESLATGTYKQKNFGAIVEPCVFKQDSEESGDDAKKPHQQLGTAESCPIMTSIPAVLLQKKLNRKMLFPSSYETPELEAYENIYDKYENSCKMSNDDKPPGRNKSISSDTYDYRTPEFDQTNSSLVTIFSVWNTTVGSSLLAMAWGIEKTGLFPSILINIVLAALCLYTAAVLLNINEKHGVVGATGEVCDLCKALLGRWAEYLSKIFSMVVLLGACIVYWILMSNFLYNSVRVFYESVFNGNNVVNTSSATVILPNPANVLCPKNQTILAPQDNLTALALSSPLAPPPNLTTFDKIWDLYSTVPILLAVVMFPMLNWKSATFFAKFNSLGTLSVVYLIVFVAAKGITWGVNITDWVVEFNVKSTFCALSGMLSMSYFIHNIIISLMRNNRHQEHNTRDLTIAFGCVTFTYLFLGVVYYITFPLPKFCIEDNILNNFDQFDFLTITARVLLLFQLFTVFPLISFLLRTDILAHINSLFKNYRFGDFTYGRVVMLNVGLVTVCILFACFLPRIGTLIRYTGALSGLVYVFFLPNLLKIASLKKEGNLTTTRLVIHISFMVGGGLNLLSQFFISD